MADWKSNTSSDESTELADAHFEGNDKHRFSPSQVFKLEMYFGQNKRPGHVVYAKIAREIGTTPRKVRTWFQNKRTRTHCTVPRSQRVSTKRNYSFYFTYKLDEFGKLRSDSETEVASSTDTKEEEERTDKTSHSANLVYPAIEPPPLPSIQEIIPFSFQPSPHLSTQIPSFGSPPVFVPVYYTQFANTISYGI